MARREAGTERAGGASRPRRADGSPARVRPRPKRARVSTLAAAVAVGLALVVGIVIGYMAAGDPEPRGLVTEERPVPVVTVTVPADP